MAVGQLFIYFFLGETHFPKFNSMHNICNCPGMQDDPNIQTHAPPCLIHNQVACLCALLGSQCELCQAGVGGSLRGGGSGGG